MVDMPTYVIIVVLVVLKILIWVCIFRYRSRRRAMLTRSCQRGIIIIQTESSVNPGMGRDRDLIMPNETMPPYSGGIDNPQGFVQSPPAYDDIIKQGGMDNKPPSYEQVIGANQAVMSSENPQIRSSDS